MYKVSIKDARFAVKIGLYPEEQYINNQLIVNATIGKKSDIAQLPFLDYSALYQCIEKAVYEIFQTLEAVLERIVFYIKELDNSLDYIQISIQKLHPPIVGNIAAAEVNWEYSKA